MVAVVVHSVHFLRDVYAVPSNGWVCAASGLAQGEIDAGEADGLPVSGNARPLHNPLGDLIAVYTHGLRVWYTTQYRTIILSPGINCRFMLLFCLRCLLYKDINEDTFLRAIATIYSIGCTIHANGMPVSAQDHHSHFVAIAMQQQYKQLDTHNGAAISPVTIDLAQVKRMRNGSK